MSTTLKTLMAVSILLNLLLAGFICGHAARPMMADRWHNTINDIAKALPDDKRAHFETVMHRTEADNAPLFAQLEEIRDQATKLLKAEPFNQKAFLAKTHEMDQIHAQLKQRLSKAIAQVAEDLNVDERGQVAELLRRPPLPQDKNCAKQAAAR